MTGVFCALLAIVAFTSVITPETQKAQAATSKTLNFQARLLSSTGAIVPDGNYNIEFKLYDANSGGSLLWTETRYDSNGVTAGNDNRVQVKAGYVSVYLGDITDLPSNIWDKQLWLTMNIGGSTQTATPTWDGEMNPRLRLTAVPAAYSLTNYNSVTGFSSSLTIAGATGGDQSFVIPDQGAAGTYSLLTTNAGIQNQSATDQTADFRISGTGRANTALQAPLFDTASAAALAIGTTNATAINLNQNTTIASTKSLTVAAGATSLTGLGAGGSTALTVATGNATNKGVVVQGAASQSANALEVQDNSGNVNLAVNAAGNQLTLGRIAGSGTVTQGTLVFADGTTSGFGATVVSDTLTADRKFILPDTALATTASPGTICVYNGASSNCPAATGSAFYIQNGTTVQTAASYYIRAAAVGDVVGVLEGANGQTADLLRLNTFNGTTSTTVARFTAAGNLNIASTLDTDTAVALNIGTTNATGINLNQNTTVAAAKTLTVTSGLTSLTGSTTGDALNVSNSTSTGNIALFKDNATTIFTLADGGAATFQNSVNSTAALQVQNAIGSDLIKLDTVGVTNLVDNSSLEANSNTGWAIKGGSGAVSRDTTQAYIGSASEKVELTSTAVNDGARYTPVSFPAGTYTLSFVIKQTAGDAFGTAFAAGYSNGTDQSCTLTPSNSAQPVSSTGWVRYSCTFTTTGTPSYIYWKETDTPAVARTFFLDAVQLESGSTGNVYGEGKLQLNAAITSPLLVQNSSDSTVAVRIRDTSGNNIFTADTLNNKAIFGTATNNTTSAATQVLIQAASGNRGLAIEGNGTQDILDLYSSTGGNVAGFSAAGDLFFGSGANHTITVATQTTTNANGANLSVSAATANGTGAGGTVSLTGGAASATAGSNGGAVSISGAAGSSTGTGGVGGSVALTAGNAGGSGNNNGGGITLQAGSATGSGTIGRVLVKNAADATNAFEVQKAGSTTSVLSVDTTNNRIGIGTSTPTRQIHVALTDGANPVTVKVQNLQGNGGESRVMLSTSGTLSNETTGAAITAHRTDALVAGDTDLYLQTSAGATLNTQVTIKSDGAALFKNSTDSATAFRVQNAAGTTTVLNADTTNGRLGVNSAAPQARLEVVGDIISAGTEWTTRTSAANNGWQSVAYGNGRFVAVAGSGTGNRIMSSVDGMNWVIRTSAGDHAWRSVTYGNGLFVAVACGISATSCNTTAGGSRVMTSPDGITWTARTAAADNQWQGVTYGNGLFVAVANSGTSNRVMTSPDGIVWTSRAESVGNSWVSVTFGNGTFVAVSNSGTSSNRVMYSTDGISWSTGTSASGNSWTSIAYGNGVYVAVAATGTGDRVMSSADGQTFTTRTSAADNDWNGVAYGAGLFVAVAGTGTGNRVMTSPDGTNWVTRTSSVDNTWNSVAFGNGVFTAVASSGTGDRSMSSGKPLSSSFSGINTYQGGITSYGTLAVNVAETSGSGQTITLTNTSGTQTSGLTIDRNAAGGTTTSLLDLQNSAGTATNAINIGAGTFTTGINLNGATFTNLIDSTNFDVSNAGAVTAVGVDSGTGLLQGTGGLTVTGTAQINATGAGATTIGNSGAGTLTLQGNASSTIVANSGANSITVGFATPTAVRTYTIPDSSATTDTFCLQTLANCSGGSTTLQTAYTASTGGTTPEIRLDTTRNGLDIQDTDAGLGSSVPLFVVRGSATSSTLGTSLFSVSNDSGSPLVGIGLGSQAAQSGFDLQFGGTADRTIQILQNPSAGFGRVLTVAAGQANGASTGGALTLNAGASDNSIAGSNGGSVSISAASGSGTGTGGVGGSIALAAGDSGGSGNNGGGTVSIDAGAATGTGTGGQVSIQGGAGGSGATGNGGLISLSGGVANSTNGAGGAISLSAGDSTGSTAGGAISLTAGTGGATGAGGALTVTAGTGGASSGTGGALTLQAGDAAGTNSNGGALILNAGTKTGSGTAGAISIGTTTASAVTVGNAAAAFTIQGSASSTLVANSGANSITVGFASPTAVRTYTIPDSTALTDTFCLVTLANCSGSANTLHTAYTASTGGTTSEIVLDTTRNGVDIQDRDSGSGGTIGATQSLLTVRASAATGNLGASLFNVNASGKVGINIGSTSATPTISNDLSFGEITGVTTARTIGVEAQTTSNTGGNGLTLAAGSGLGTGTGGLLTLQAGAAGATAGAVGGGVTIQATAGVGNTTASGAGGAVTVTAGAGGGGGTTGTGADGGAISLITGLGGSVTSSGNAGYGGNISLTTASGGAAAGSGIAGDSGAITLTVGTGGAATSGTTSNGGWASNITLQGGTGGASAGTSGVGGNGSSVQLFGGTGGAGTAGNAKGGDGGLITLQSGNGGASVGTGVNASGGNLTLQAGNGGTGGSGGGGAAGTVTIQGGTGGATNVAGGAVTVTGGTASGTAAGGLLTLQGGAASATAGSAGGGVTISASAGSTTTTGGAGGALTLQAGSAGGTGNNAGGAVSITAGTSRGTANGGAITITSGGNTSSQTGLTTTGAITIATAAGSASNMVGTGDLSLQTGNASGGTLFGSISGAISITTGTGGTGTGASATGGAAGNITIQSGNGGNGFSTADGGAGGTINVVAGNGGTGGANGTAGAINLTAGNAGTSGVAGGSITLTAGTAGATSNGGNITLLAGAANGSSVSAGGAVSISGRAGSSFSTGGVGGAVSITGGSAGGSGNNTGGAISLTAGNSRGTTVGAAVTLQAGTGGATGAGGLVGLTGGTGGSTGGTGGGVTLTGGTATGANAGGAITLQGGAAAAVAGSAGGAISILGANGSTTTTGAAGGGITLTAGNAGGTGANAGGNVSITAGTNASGGTGTAGSVSINGGAASATNTAGGTVTIQGGAGNGTQAGGSLSVLGGTGGATGAGGALTVRAGTGGATSGAGGLLTIQGGNAAGTNSAGGNVTITGGTGTGTGLLGLVSLAPTAFLVSGSTQTFGSNGSVTGVDTASTIPISASTTGLTITIPAPGAANQVIGRILYVANVGATNDVTISLAGTLVTIALKPNSTATLIWNGNGWTAAGASSSTDLQAAYNNTATSAGGAELVLNASGGAADGLTVRNNASSPITGGLLEVQTSIGSNLFSVNNNATEYANNGGAETSTFTMWPTAPNGGTTATITRTTTAGTFATGQAAVQVVTTGATTANQGVANTLSAALTANLVYTVAFTVKSTASFSTLDVVYSRDGTNTSTTACATGKTVTQASFTRIECTFTAPSSGITASNAVFIRQSNSNTTAATYYVDNLSVTINASTTHATDGTADVTANIGGGTNSWAAYDADGGAGTSTVSANSTTIYDTSGSVQVVTTTGAGAGEGVYNAFSITPSVSTQYLVSFYVNSSTTFTDLRVGFLPAGGSSLPVSAQLCADYNAASASIAANTWTKVTCVVTTPSAGITTPRLVIYQGSSAARTFYVDALTITLNTNNSSNVQVGGGRNGGPTTLFTLDRASTAPIAANNDAYLGSMYYDTTTGRIQCYEADGWGACGAAPDNIVNLNPEFPGAVLNGTKNSPNNVGTMSADFCGNGAGLSINTGLCASGEARNFYQWTSPQASQQTYSIYVTYQLPATFNGFSDDNTIQLTGRVDDTATAAVTYEMFKSQSGTLTQCGSGETAVTSSNNTWQTVGLSGNEATGCSFTSSAAGAFLIFKINVKAQSNANAYVGTLSFTTTNK